MDKLTYIVLGLLFVLQGTNQHNVMVSALFLLLLVCVFIPNKQKIKLPKYYIIAFFIYSFYLFIGIFNNHKNPIVDIKFQFFSFAFFFCLLNLNLNYLKLLFITNTIVFVLYILLFFDLIPNIWSENTFGFGGRVYGPSIIAINLLLLFYLFEKKSYDKKLIVASIMGFVCIALTTNFMNLAVFIVLVLLLAINLKKLFRPVYIIGFLIMLLGGLWYLNSPFVPDLVSEKMKYIYTPWEYGSLKTRVEDFNKAINSENFNMLKKIFGEGFGASTSIYRENKVAPSLSRTFNFQEIDNGFYYLYHRGGWSLLMIFILSHLYLLLKINGIKAKLGFMAFIIITNILSIHYFNYYFYLLIPFFILYRKNISEKFNRA